MTWTSGWLRWMSRTMSFTTVVLPALGGEDDEPTLTLADGSDKVDDAGGSVSGEVGLLQRQTLIGEQRGEVVEVGSSGW